MSWSHISAVSLNQFSDMTFGEFKKTYLWSEPQVKMSTRLFVWIFVRDAGPIFFFFFFLVQNCSATRGNYRSSNKLLPDSVDWRKKGNYVTDVKNQVEIIRITVMFLFSNSFIPQTSNLARYFTHFYTPPRGLWGSVLQERGPKTHVFILWFQYSIEFL